MKVYRPREGALERGATWRARAGLAMPRLPQSRPVERRQPAGLEPWSVQGQIASLRANEGDHAPNCGISNRVDPEGPVVRCAGPPPKCVRGCVAYAEGAKPSAQRRLRLALRVHSPGA